MNNLRKFITYCLSLVIILQLIGNVAVYAETNNDQQASIDETTFAKLRAFGILEEDDDLLYEDSISRGLFATYCSRLLPDGICELKENPYSDVSSTDVGYTGIMTLYSLGYVSGNKGDCFRPDDNINMAEAARILIGILGYDFGRDNMSYPNDYLKEANKLKIFNSLNGDSVIDTYEMAEIMLSVLLCDVVDIDKIEKKPVDNINAYLTNEGNGTLLAKNLGIYVWRGILETNQYTHIYSDERLSENYVEINGKVFKAGETDMDDLLGLYVNIYYSDDENSTVVYAEMDNNKNNLCTVYSGDIDKSSVSPSGFTYYDKDSKKNKTVKFDNIKSMIFNRRFESFNTEYLKDDDSYITLIDNDNDGKEEIISVMKYKSIIVSAKTSDGKITDKSGNVVFDLDEETSKFDVRIVKDNKKCNYDDIQAGDIVSVAESNGHSYKVKNVLISSKRIEGIVTGKDADGIYIDDVFYELAYNNKTDYSLGWFGEHYCDVFGKIVSSEMKNDTVYGYLNYLDRKSGRVQAKIFTENNRWVILNIKRSFTLNGRKKNADDFFNENKASTNLYRQLIRYKVNEEAEIIEINTAEECSPWEDGYSEKVKNDEFRKHTLKTSAMYRASIGAFIREYDGTLETEVLVVDSKTKIFKIPYQEENKSAHDEDFYIISNSQLIQDLNYVGLTGYDCDELLYAKACVMIDRVNFINFPRVNSLSNLFLVTKLSRGTKGDSFESDILTGYYMGSEISIKTSDDEVLKSVGGVNKGDIIQFGLDINGTIGSVSKKFDSKSGFEQKFGSTDTSIWSSNKFLGGEVVKIDNDSGNIAVDLGVFSVNDEGEVKDKNRINVFSTKNASTIYLYDTSLKEAKKITMSEIQVGDYIAAVSSYYRLTQIVVYRL